MSTTDSQPPAAAMTAAAEQREPTPGPCDLCGGPTLPGEQNLHLACARAENYSDER